MTRIGIVLLNYNDYKLTEVLLQQLQQFESINSICVVDNCSTNESYDCLQKFESAKCHMMEAGYNSGYAAGNNLGCRYLLDNALADIIFIMNSDILITETELKKIAGAFDNNPDYMILSGIMHDSDGSVDTRPFLYIPSFWQDTFLCFYLYNRIYERRHSYSVDYGIHVMPVDAVPGCMWAIRAEALKTMDYLDEGTFLYFEEFTTAMRLRACNPGWKIGIVTDAHFIHNHSVTIRKHVMEYEIFKIYMDSKMYFEHKYHNLSSVQMKLLQNAVKISLFEKKIFLILRKYR